MHWWFGARARVEDAYHCEGDVLMYLGVECVLLCSLERECSGLVLWLSGESRFRSMVRESSLELKPRCLSKVEGGFTARSAAGYSPGKVLSESLRRSRLFFRRFFSN
jgi:hypothetical protein